MWIHLPLKTKDKMIHNDKKNGPLRQGYFERRAVLRNAILKKKKKERNVMESFEMTFT